MTKGYTRSLTRDFGSMQQRRDVDGNKSYALNIIGSESSHDTLLGELAMKPPARILDVPAGEGVLAQFLVERGWDVQCADIDPGNFKLHDVAFTKVDLNDKLPYADCSFDAVSCINGLHRLLFPGVALKEFARILRPNGTLYINLNNYSSIRRRLRFLILGSIDRELETQECKQTVADPRAHVRLPLMYPRLESMLREADLQVVKVAGAAYTLSDRLLVPFAFLAWLAGRLLLTSGQRAKLRVSYGNEWRILAGGHYFYLEAKKCTLGMPRT